MVAVDRQRHFARAKNRNDGIWLVVFIKTSHLVRLIRQSFLATKPVEPAIALALFADTGVEGVGRSISVCTLSPVISA